MADILLTHANHLYFDPKQVRKMQPYPPLQTLIAAACLRGQGYDVALFDATLTPPEEGFREALDRDRPRLVAVCEDNFNFLTKMCLTRNRELTFSMFEEARLRGVPVVVNSSDATDHVASYLDAGADFVVIGELENTLLETAGHLLGRGSCDPEEIAGLSFRHPETGELSVTRQRPLMGDLDWLPPPAWDLVDVEAYGNAWRQAHGYFSLNLVSSRGCPYRCNWCAKPVYGDTYHFRSPEKVAEEMAYIKTKLGADHVWFADDIFALSNHWTLRFGDAVAERNAQIRFKMQSRCDLMTRETVGALRKAGCEEVWMGVESGSQKVLDAMDKDIRLEQTYRARQNLRDHGIRACYFLQFGYPGEKWDDIRQTIQLVRETQPDDIGVSVSYPLPGTKFHDRVAAQLGAKTNWSHSDDLAVMFQGEYASEFYRALRDALHHEVDSFNGRAANGRARLDQLWSEVEQLEQTCASPDPTPQWTSC